VSKIFLPIYRTYYNYVAPIYEVNKTTNEINRIQEKETVYEVTLYDRKGNLITTQVK
jgi:hypothetical protein